MPPVRGRVRTGDCARPYPRDHVRFAAAVLLGQADLWVEMTDLLLRPFADETTVVAHVGRKAVRAVPRLSATDALHDLSD